MFGVFCGPTFLGPPRCTGCARIGVIRIGRADTRNGLQDIPAIVQRIDSAPQYGHINIPAVFGMVVSSTAVMFGGWGVAHPLGVEPKTF